MNYDKAIERCKRLKEIQALLDHVTFPRTCLIDKIVVNITDLAFLTDARAKVKQVIPTWQDRLGTVWNTFGQEIIVSWEDENNPEMEIWLRTSISQFPKELLPKDGCEFKPTTETSYRLVCDI